MKARLLHVLLAIVAITGVVIAGMVAHSEASSAMAQVGATPHDAAASTFSAPF